LLDDPGAELPIGRITTEQRLHEPLRVRLRQRAERHRQSVALPAAPGGTTLEELRTRAGDDEHRDAFDVVDESVDFATARWVTCPDPERLEAFRKANQENLALDAEGNLTYLAASEWRLQFVMEKWPEIVFLKTREHD